ncbi:MAG: HypC/HybG/HupF family hydrogenase formation chaperone [Bacillota bacterium]|jgi:hydrogenase expression/formation protein HypC
MCLAIAGKIIKINRDTVIIDFGGVSTEASLRLFSEVKEGDCVLVHEGCVIKVLNPDEGRELMKLNKERGFYGL